MIPCGRTAAQVVPFPWLALRDTGDQLGLIPCHDPLPPPGEKVSANPVGRLGPLGPVGSPGQIRPAAPGGKAAESVRTPSSSTRGRGSATGSPPNLPPDDKLKRVVG